MTAGLYACTSDALSGMNDLASQAGQPASSLPGTPDPTQPAADGGVTGASRADALGDSTALDASFDDEAEDEVLTGTQVGTGDPAERDYFATVFVEDADSFNLMSQGDIWANCWSDDDAVYTASGDGRGFGHVPYDVFVGKIEGRPGDGEDPLRGDPLAYGDYVSSLWNSSLDYGRKPTSMLCIDGDLYLAVQDNRLITYDDAPAATIVRSSDKGKTWTWDVNAPMFSDHVFTTIMFLDYGKDSQHAPDDYVYAYGLDNNWSFNSSLEPPTKLYLGRVLKDRIQDRTQWTFFAGMDANNEPSWTSDIAARQPVLDDPRKVYTRPLTKDFRYPNMTVLGLGGVLYNAPLQRYLYTSFTEYTFEFYEAPSPWGPWKRFYSKDFGDYPWTDTKNGGYALTIPSKFVSLDGKSMLLQSNTWFGGALNYGFSLRRMSIQPYRASEPANAPSDEPLSDPSQGAVVIGRAFHEGMSAQLNDGVIDQQSESSWTGEAKPVDYWGYTWPSALFMNELRYATGAISEDGGWFKNLRVEVRRGAGWQPVTGLTVDPLYTYDEFVPPNTLFTLRFDAVSGDGIRIVGAPGGPYRMTSISELGVFYKP